MSGNFSPFEMKLLEELSSIRQEMGSIKDKHEKTITILMEMVHTLQEKVSVKESQKSGEKTEKSVEIPEKSIPKPVEISGKVEISEVETPSARIVAEPLDIQNMEGREATFMDEDDLDLQRALIQSAEEHREQVETPILTPVPEEETTNYIPVTPRRVEEERRPRMMYSPDPVVKKETTNYKEPVKAEEKSAAVEITPELVEKKSIVEFEYPKGRDGNETDEEGSPITITITDWSGNSIHLDVMDGMQLRSLKDDIEWESGCSADEQLLTLDGKQLDGTCTSLGRLGVKHGSVIHLKQKNLWN